MSLRTPLLPALAICAALSALPASAQSASATLKGTVRDAAKAPVAGATVTATDQATKASVKATTGADGSYTLSLPPGLYSVTASAPGFWEPAVSLEVAAGRESQADFSLITRPTEVISVTAAKKESAPIDVPFSVEARSEQDLRDRGAQDLEDVAANVASFSVQNLGPGQSQVAMRGASSGQIARDQPGVKEQVGAYLDDSPISLSLFTPDLDLFDVSRVEVLRGPQGTLFGAGSLSGTVRYITNAWLIHDEDEQAAFRRAEEIYNHGLSGAPTKERQTINKIHSNGVGVGLFGSRNRILDRIAELHEIGAEMALLRVEPMVAAIHDIGEHIIPEVDRLYNAPPAKAKEAV